MNQNIAQSMLRCVHFALQNQGSNALNDALIVRQYVSVELAKDGQEPPEIDEKEED